jgi:hypothetical protein
MTIRPARLQMKRAKGFNLQKTSQWANGLRAVLVTRPGAFGNPFYLGGFHKVFRPGEDPKFPDWKTATTGRDLADATFTQVQDAATAVALYREYLGTWGAPKGIERLRGLNLACYCRVCEQHAHKGKPFDEECADCAPCHADVLGRLANGMRCEGL